MTPPVTIAPPTRPALELSEVSRHLRGIPESEETLVSTFIAAAAAEFQKLTGRALYETEFEVGMDYWEGCSIMLPRACPLISVTSVKYTDSTGAETTVSPSDYVVDAATGRIAPAYGKTWPSFTPKPIGAIQIRYRAGIPDATSPPKYIDDGIRVTLLNMVASLYRNREEFEDSERSGIAKFQKNPTIQRMIEFYRVNRSY